MTTRDDVEAVRAVFVMGCHRHNHPPGDCELSDARCDEAEEALARLAKRADDLRDACGLIRGLGVRLRRIDEDRAFADDAVEWSREHAPPADVTREPQVTDAPGGED